MASYVGIVRCPDFQAINAKREQCGIWPRSAMAIPRLRPFNGIPFLLNGPGTDGIKSASFYRDFPEK
jgi:hypothetical protein